MIRFFYGTIFLFSIIIFSSSCHKKEFDKYFGRPDSLAPPIYTQLQTRGNFTGILALIDKAGFKTTLGTAGYWTFFAPNDAAIQDYLKTNNIGSVANIDSTTAAALLPIAYCQIRIVKISLHNSKHQKVQPQTTPTAEGLFIMILHIKTRPTRAWWWPTTATRRT